MDESALQLSLTIFQLPDDCASNFKTTLLPFLNRIPVILLILRGILSLIARENNLCRIDVGSAVAQELLARPKRWALGNVGLILKLDLRFADSEKSIVLVTLVVQILFMSAQE